jgi:hypothetical protein
VANGRKPALRWAFVNRYIVRAVAVTAAVAVVAGLVVVVVEPTPLRPAERLARQHAGPLRPDGSRRPRTIVMVVFDELPLTSLMGPGGRIDAGRYPAFARLARGATWYRGATAVHDSTALAVPALLDGRYPRAGLRSDVYSHPANLFTLLAPSYEVNAAEEATSLCPTSLCEPEPGTTLGRLAHGRVERFRRFVSSIRRRPGRALWFKHVLLPHVPWQFYPSGRRYRRRAPEPIPGLNGPRGFGEPWLVKISYQRHLLQLGLADRLLGELLGRLRRLGLYRGALVVVAADHGIGFHVDMDRRAVTPRNAQDLAPIPLFVKHPGQSRGGVVDRHVETIDVLPTILELARVPAPERLDGRSLLRRGHAPARRVTIFHRVGKTLNTVGGDYTFQADALEQRWQRAVRRKLALFGSGGGREPTALFRIGPHLDLLGRRAASLPRARGLATAWIHQAAELRRVDPASGFVPGEITGELPDGEPGGGRPIALVVNGAIAATAWTFSLEDSPVENFEAILPERALQRGANEVRVFEIVTRRRGRALRPL